MPRKQPSVFYRHCNHCGNPKAKFLVSQPFGRCQPCRYAKARESYHEKKAAQAMEEINNLDSRLPAFEGFNPKSQQWLQRAI